jgi:histidinol phosphatase-like enzyme
MPEKQKREAFRNDKRRKHHHWVATLFYADGEKFERVYVDREKARRFAERQKKSPLVLKARVTEQS